MHANVLKYISHLFLRQNYWLRLISIKSKSYSQKVNENRDKSKRSFEKLFHFIRVNVPVFKLETVLKCVQVISSRDWHNTILFPSYSFGYSVSVHIVNLPCWTWQNANSPIIKTIKYTSDVQATTNNSYTTPRTYCNYKAIIVLLCTSQIALCFPDEFDVNIHIIFYEEEKSGNCHSFRRFYSFKIKPKVLLTIYIYIVIYVLIAFITLTILYAVIRRSVFYHFSSASITRY